MNCDAMNRLKSKRGEELPQSRLNETLVKKIREEHKRKLSEIYRLNAGSSAKAIAKRYGVHHRTIEKVLSYETWKHVLD